jgi:ribosome-associated heat shock protein Hsp15
MHLMDDGVRVDKWLWAARLVKTRALAQEAVKGGRVHVNGRATKPGKELKPGDRLELVTGPVRRTVDVLALSHHRRPAPEAALLYDETPESIAAREQQREERRLAAPIPDPVRGGRPTKRDRRRYEEAAPRGRSRARNRAERRAEDWRDGDADTR